MKTIFSQGRFCAAALLGWCILSAAAARAAEPDWPERKVSLRAQEQPLRQFLQNLFNAAGMRALPDDSVSGRISGEFSDAPEKIFNDVVKAYGLLPYYDGTAMHIAAAAEMRSKSIRVPAAQIDHVMQAVKASGIVDRHQSIQAVHGSGLIKVRGAPEFIAAVDEVIATQQRPRAGAPQRQGSPSAGGLVFRSFALKYASATDLNFFQNGREVRIPGVASLLRGMVGVGGSLIATSSEPELPRDRSVPSFRDRERGRSGYDEERGEPRREPQQASGFVSDRQSLVRIEADPNLNTVLVRDYEDSMALYEDLIAQLDKEPQLIEIQVTIVDIDRSKLLDLGVDWRFSDQRNSIAAGGSDPGPFDGGLLLNTVLGNSGNFLARVNVLAKDGSARIVSRPQVLTLSNLEAVLTTDQSFFVRVAGREDVDLFNVSVGTSLRVVPYVAGDPANPQIRLRVAIEDGSFNADQTVDDIPIVDRASLNTQAVIFDGQSLLLGGLVRDETTKDVSKVPLLGDVPGVGHLFKRTVDVKSRQERLFLISPRIITGNRPGNVGTRPPGNAVVPTPITAGAAAPRNAAPQPVTPPPQAYLDGF